MMLRQALFAALVLAGSHSAVAQTATDAPIESLSLEGVAAIVNDSPISYSDVRQRARLLLLSFGGGQPTPEQIQQITGQALEQLIDEKLQLNRVAEFEVVVAPEEIDNAVNDMASQSGLTGDVLRQQLIEAGVNPVSLEEQMRADIAWNRLMNGLYGSRIRISDSQIADQMERLRTSSQKTQFRISEIFLFAPDPETRAQALAAAQSIMEQLRQGADFRVAAQRISSAPTAATGGDMGWIGVDDLPEAVSAAVAAATEPGLIGPIEVENGVYILSLVNKREPSQLTTKVDLKRLVATDGQESTLREAMDRITSCADVNSVANSRTTLRASDLEDINVDELGEEGRALVLATDLGKPTEAFAAGSGLAVMYVCRRQDGAEALPSREDLRNTLKSREISMISDRELRNTRRDSTVIYR